MKAKQKNNYLLLAAVIVVWSVVVYKLFYSRHEPIVKGNDSKPLAFISHNSDFEKFEIKVNYRDPFLSAGKIKPLVPKKIRKKTSKPAVLFPKIKYAGVLKSKDAYRFLIEIDRQQYCFNLKDTFKDVTLVSGDDNRITIVYQSVRQDYVFKE